MKKIAVLTAITILILTGAAWADPRIDEVTGSCHFIHNNRNANDESKVLNCQGQIVINRSETENAQGFALVVLKNIPRGLARFIRDSALGSEENDELAAKSTEAVAKNNNNRKITQRLRITSDDFPGQNCNLVDEDGSLYQSENWINAIIYSFKPRENVGTLTYRLYCQDAIAD